MTLILVTIALLFVAVSKATAADLHARKHRQIARLNADRGSLRFCRNHPKAKVFCTAKRLRFVRARIGWTTRELGETIRALQPIPHLPAWLCIHAGEARWNDPDPPYYGGLQMDVEFQRTYAPWLLRSKGTADHWTPREQMLTAERAWKTRGFWPWPNTARRCGLL